MSSNGEEKKIKMDRNKLIKAIIFTLLLPGAEFFLFPNILFYFWDDTFKLEILRYAGLALMVGGFILYIICVKDFLIQGDGTPMFWFSEKTHLDKVFGEEPKNLVSSGIYRRSRNPMYLSELIFILGQALFVQSYILFFFYVPAVFVVMHLIVIYSEEKHLKEKYGEVYENYIDKTPRWIGFSSLDEENNNQNEKH